LRKLFFEWERGIKQAEIQRPELSEEMIKEFEPLGYLVK
jgi:hypothetical protein